MVGVELFLYLYGLRGYSIQTPAGRSRYTVCGRAVHPFLAAIYKTIGPFAFGVAVNQVLTDITKYSVGRLRPHFFAVCEPDYSSFSCEDSAGRPLYITADVCSGTDEKALKEAR